MSFVQMIESRGCEKLKWIGAVMNGTGSFLSLSLYDFKFKFKVYRAQFGDVHSVDF